MHPIQPETLALGFIWYAVFLFSTTCHGAAHALAAKLGGDPTAFHGGQVTLNPIPHIRREPLGTVVAPILSYLLGGWMIGWASAPYDSTLQQGYPGLATWMALAVAPANFLVGLCVAASVYVTLDFGGYPGSPAPIFLLIAV